VVPKFPFEPPEIEGYPPPPLPSLAAPLLRCAGEVPMVPIDLSKMGRPPPPSTNTQDVVADEHGEQSNSADSRIAFAIHLVVMAGPDPAIHRASVRER
jgi:hypothetical protein